MRERSVRMVVFDLGGVVVRICRSWEQGCEAAGLDVRPSATDTALKAARKGVHARYQRGEIECDAFCEQLAHAMDNLYSAEEVRRIHDAWLLGEYEGIDRLIDDIHGAGLATGVLSNTNHAHWVRLANLDERREFPSIPLVRHLHASHLLGLAKPDPGIYSAFERHAGHDADQLVFFDDLEDNVDAARRAGWNAFRIDHDQETAEQMRTHLLSLGVAL